jgi:hypothetical protein
VTGRTKAIIVAALAVVLAGGTYGLGRGLYIGLADQTALAVFGNPALHGCRYLFFDGVKTLIVRRNGGCALLAPEGFMRLDSVLGSGGR